jgi:hypothetical protein
MEELIISGISPIKRLPSSREASIAGSVILSIYVSSAVEQMKLIQNFISVNLP